MPRLFSPVLPFVLAVMLSGCGEDEDRVTPDSILGTWKLT